MAIPIYQVDAFSAVPWRGNPAAVCLLDQPAAEEWMQAVAAEMNLSETAFLLAEGDGWRLRWFTPRLEVDLCGHATLAAAHVLWETGRLAAGAEARFFTRSGLLTAQQRDGWIEMSFPSTPPKQIEPPPGLAEALGVSPRYVGITNQPDYFVVIDEEDKLRACTPDFVRLVQFPVRGVILTCRSGGGFDFVSRFFAPRAGVAEDPVTGSAHAALGPYWGALLFKDTLETYQASPRGGTLRIRLAGERVLISGQAVTVLKGELTAQV
ncbi:MAG: PhzF family phenazine biosynthesis protein [Anaerolineae bacterium]|nr:PhzF family phenazine biosynthesis protein [Anaerolineae bacterium]